MKKRVFSFLLCLCMVITLLPATALADEITTEPKPTLSEAAQEFVTAVETAVSQKTEILTAAQNYVSAYEAVLSAEGEEATAAAEETLSSAENTFYTLFDSGALLDSYDALSPNDQTVVADSKTALDALIGEVDAILNAEGGDSGDEPTNYGLGTPWDSSAVTTWYDAGKNDFILTTPEELAGLAKLVNEGNDFFEKTVKLGADIILNATPNGTPSATARQWTPIGTAGGNGFAGMFDGCGHTISGLYINNSDNYQALFGFVSARSGTTGGEIRNLGLVNSSVTCSSFAGGITAEGNILRNCYSDADVTAKSGYAAGIAAAPGNGIMGCYNSGTITAPQNAGGIMNASAGMGVYRSCYGLKSAVAGTTVASSYSAALGYLSDIPQSKSSGAGFDADGNVDGGDTLVGRLNTWVYKQDSSEYYTWKNVDGGFPTFDAPLNTQKDNISGTVSVPESKSASGITVKLYSVYDDTFSDPLCETTTGTDGSFTIAYYKGDYVLRVAPSAGNYGAVTKSVQLGSGDVTGCDIVLPAVAVESIAVTSTNHKTAYIVGENLNVTNLKIKVTKNDGTTETVDVTKDMVTGFDSAAVNESLPLTITYQGTTTTYIISVDQSPYTGTQAKAPASTSVTTNSVTLAAQTITGETVEYAMSDSSAAPKAGWSETRSFTGLSAANDYYFFARVKATDNHAAGVAMYTRITTLRGSIVTQDVRIYRADVTISDAGGGKIRVDTGLGSSTYNASDELVISGSSTTKYTITVNTSCYITLSGVSIDRSAVSDSCAFKITSGTVRLTLAPGTTNTLKSGANCAGLQCTSGKTVIIGGSGTLTAVGGYLGAGIGGCAGANRDAGTITINSGAVTANGGYPAAGIGGGSSTDGGGNGGTITINGGVVNAIGSSYGTGIGGGGLIYESNNTWNGGDGGTITINGGSVTAKSSNGTAIGGGSSVAGMSNYSTGGSGGTIRITGGTVIADGNNKGIGHGDWGSGESATVTGGNLNSDSPTSKLINGSSATVYKATFYVPGAVAGTPVTLTNVSPSYYGTTDLMTLNTNAVYLYLPAGDASFLYNGVRYHTTVTTDGKAVFKGPQAISAAVTMTGYTYGEAVSTPEVTGNTGSGAVTYYYNTTNSNSGGKVWTTSTKLNAGDYYLYATIAAAGDYQACTTESVPFTVEKANLTTPDKPTKSSANSSSITVNSTAGQLYYIKLSDNTAPTADAAGWKKATDTSYTFANLSPNKSYDIYTCLEGDLNHNRSDVSEKLTVSTGMSKITAVEAPTNVTLTDYYSTGAEAIAGLPGSAVATLDGGGTQSLNITWTAPQTYDTVPSHTNTYTWSVTAPLGYAFDGNVTATGEITVTNKAPTAVTITATEDSNKLTRTYAGTTFDVTDLFIIDTNAGAQTYSVTPDSGEGAITAAGVLTVTKAGTFAVKVDTAAKGNYDTGSKTATLTIEKGTGSGTVTLADWVYGATESTPVPTSTTNGITAVTYSYAGNGGTSYTASAAAPTEVGSYKVTATFAATDLYNQCTADNTFSITPAELNKDLFTFTANDALTYTGSTKPATVKAKANGNFAAPTGDITVFYELKTGEGAYGSRTSTAPTDVGTYRVSIDVTANGNYQKVENLTDSTWTFTIANAEITNHTVSQSGTLTYNGAEQTAAVSKTPTTAGSQTASYTYCTTQDGTYDEAVPAFTTAGEHTVYYKVTASNHSDASGSFTITIGALDLSTLADGAITVIPNTNVYTGEEWKPAVTVKVGDKTIPADDYTVSYENNIEAGDVTVTATAKTTNCTSAKSVTRSITAAELTKDSFTYNAPAGSMVYDAQSREATFTPKANGNYAAPTGDITVFYELKTGEGTYGTRTSSAPTDVGTYRVSIDVAANGNYQAITNLTVDDWHFTIKQSTVTALWKNTTKVYTGGSLSPDFELVGLQNGASAVIAQLTESKTDAGTYTVTAELTGDKAANYTLTNPSGTFIIQKAPVSFTLSGNSVKKGDSVNVTAAPSISGVAATLSYWKSGKQVADPTDEGSYDIYAEITDSNYRHADGTDGTAQKIGVLTIYQTSAPATYTLSFDANSGTGSTNAMSAAQAGTVRILPKNDFSNTNKTFAGWQYGGKTYQPGERFTQPAANVILKALWNNKVYSIGGTVQESEIPAASVVVTLMQGSQQLGQTVTNDNGEYSFANVVPGVYNLVASKNGVTQTIMVTVMDKAIADQTVTMPAGKLNSVVEVKAGSPAIVVGNLETAFTEQDKTDALTEAVELKLTAEAKAADSTNTAQQEIEKKAGSMGLYLDLTLTKTVGKGSPTTMTSSPVLLTAVITLPAELQGQGSYTVYRLHSGEDGKTEIQALTSTKNKEGEYIEVSNDKTAITVYTKNFSTYAIKGVTYATTYPVSVDTDNIKNGTITVSPTDASAGTKITITVKPDEGYKLGKLVITVENGKDISFTDNKDGTYTFTMPSSKVNISASFVKAENPFTDVSEDAYYYNAVIWAVSNGITEGTNATTFSPNSICTRGQAVTFLWRAMGSPEPTAKACPFTDVNADAYYYKAVLWAVEKGVTEGTSATTFSPKDSVTRAQAVTLQWRAAGKSQQTSENPFVDVSADAYYANAVLWALSQKITEGTTSTTFSPADGCMRGQIVTFLYRQFGK